ncbi:hypothetical protein B0H34DRAFT_679328 [Crassisporium funariophilum]|nr:hypothetical protein B0H34DRAFT_679328 [Crassisporium funariophilum]
MLDCIAGSESGKRKIIAWIKRSGLQFVCEIVSDEMDNVKQVENLPGLSHITPDFIKSWTIHDHADLAPWTTKILLLAAETLQAQSKNKIKTPQAICRIITKQLVYQQSFHSLGFQAQFGLFLWATGSARQTIEALHRMQPIRQLLIRTQDNIILSSVDQTLQVVIVRVLVTYAKEFSSYAKEPVLQHKPRRAIPAGYKTKQYPLCVTTIEEASIEGNLLYHDEVYINLLKHTTESLSRYAISSSNDQLTNSRIRSLFASWDQDTNPWNRRKVFQLGLGLFYLCSLNQTGSLTYFFNTLEKTRLGSNHLDYHSLLAALMQILDGLLLNVWRQECGDLASFAKTALAENILTVADRILVNYATPAYKDPGSQTLQTKTPPTNKSDSGTDSDTPVDDTGAEASSNQSSKPAPKTDIVHKNIRKLTRDPLYVAKLIHAISDGNIGRIEDFLPQLAMMFCGAGGNNYCTEILHFILNLKHVWTPEFAHLNRDIMRDNQLLNLSGLPGHSMPVDLNVEHLIGELKGLLHAKGLKATWDCLDDISAAINYLNTVKQQVSVVMKLLHKNRNHSDVNTKHLVWRIANLAQEQELQKFNGNRLKNSHMNAVPNLLSSSKIKLKLSSLGTFNKWVPAMASGRKIANTELDIDELPRNQVCVNWMDKVEGNSK